MREFMRNLALAGLLIFVFGSIYAMVYSLALILCGISSGM